mgnify:CR=1 FL=1
MYFSTSTSNGVTTIVCLISEQEWTFPVANILEKRQAIDAAIYHQDKLLTKLTPVTSRYFYTLADLQNG